MASYHNLVLSLCDSKTYTEAESLLPFAEVQQKLAGESMDRAKLKWIRGKILLGLQRYGEAEDCLAEAREKFTSLCDACSAAASSLDLVSCHLAQGKEATALEMARGIVPIFESRAIHREALATLELFRENLDLNFLTQDLIERLKRAFKRCRCSCEPYRS
ncbi:MAG: hypothetical protein HC897_02855 [Thermoanaerobaculia bacterium]|nr:hypothetical protein [Thermoanaerobaculia bacterium]